MKEKGKSDVSHRLIESSCDLEKSLLVFQDINQKAHFIALNAAIEGARMKSKLGTFSIVANQIAAQASKNNELSQKLEALIRKIKGLSLEAVAVRNLELAADLIDKLDRNLFERNCDVQAWGTFDSVRNALLQPSEETALTASEQLDQLVSIYMVYLDSFLLDPQGNVVAAAKRRQHRGANFSQTSWFASTLAGNITVTDVHFYPAVDTLTVCYCSPVQSADGKVIGVIANCFNWDFALEMIESGGYNPSTKAIVINSEAQVIASKQKIHLLKDNFSWLSGGETAARGGVGYSLERARNGEAISVGFYHTKGYNAYKGKGWSAVVSESVGDLQFPVSVTLTGAHGEHAAEIKADIPESEANGQIESERLGKRLLATMKEIDSLVYEINSNNRAVKLLAVNASIQAGLAGSEGEGFSIIANEVAELAKKSLNFVESVNQTAEQLNGAVEHSSSARLLDAAVDTMSKIDRNLFERYCDIQAWSTFSKFSEVLTSNGAADEETFALLAQVHKIYEVYHDIYILSPSGKVVGTAINRSLVGHDFSSRDWFTSAASGNIYVSDIYTSEALKMPLMTFSAPILDKNKTIVGVIASRFNCKFLNDILVAAIADSSSEILLVNQQDTVVVSRNADEVLKRKFPLTTANNAAPGANGLVEHKEGKNGATFTVGYACSKGYNSYKGQRWTLLTKRPNEVEANIIKLTPAERFKQKVKSVAG